MLCKCYWIMLIVIYCACYSIIFGGGAFFRTRCTNVCWTAKFYGPAREIPRLIAAKQNQTSSAACHGLPYMTENWDSSSDTSVIEDWHCTTLC